MISLRSELRRKLLTYFLVNRTARAYVRQLANQLGVDSTNLSRELARLEREGLLRSTFEGRNRYYSINTQYPFLKAVFSLLEGSVGVVPTLSKSIGQVSGVESAYIYGSFAKGEAESTSDIDLLVVGHPNATQLATEISRAEKMFKREVNYTILTHEELKRKLVGHDPFLTDIWKGKRIKLIGDEKDEAIAG